MTRERVTVEATADSREARASIVERARRRGFTRFVVDEADLTAATHGEVILVRRAGALEVLEGERRTVPIVTVRDPSDLEAALRTAPASGVLAIEWTGDRVIPLENAIAAAGRQFELWVFANGPSEVPGALGALEHGAQQVIVAVQSPEEVDALEAVLERPLPTSLDWVVVPVVTVHPVGLGDRVLVDTSSLLRPEEGLLVGSSAAFLFHVASEAVGSQFSRPRAFRVNAGAAHSYVLMADGTTRYLAELEAGDSVLVVQPRGDARSVHVGRIKIERRPLVAVAASLEGSTATVFLQEAETVRLSTEAGRVPTTEITAGTRIHGVRMPPARHLGRTVQETIIER